MKNKVLACLCALVGIGLVVNSIRQSIDEAAFLAQAKVSRGTVTALVPSRSHHHGCFAPGVTFVTQAGERIKFVSSTSSNLPIFHVGEKVDVLYLPASPQQAQIKGFFLMWGMQLIMGVAGLILAVEEIVRLVRMPRNTK